MIQNLLIDYHKYKNLYLNNNQNTNQNHDMNNNSNIIQNQNINQNDINIHLNNHKNNQLPWIEKYRPDQLSDIIGNNDSIQILKRISKNGNVPNIIISGPPGIGKTTSIHCLAKELLGDKYSESVLELNASDARGIDIVRNKIKLFAQKKTNLPSGRHKIIILDEADSMTPSAQQALRRIMEIYSNTTRFALACNTSTKIIEPIQSRCSIIRFMKLDENEIRKYLLKIIEKENISYDESGLQSIDLISDGDMRNAINNLQATYYGFKYVNSDNVFKVCDVPHPKYIINIIELCKNGNINEAIDILHFLWSLGYSSIDLIQTLFKICRKYDIIDIHHKNEILKIIGFFHMRIQEGVESELQLFGCISKISTYLSSINV